MMLKSTCLIASFLTLCVILGSVSAQGRTYQESCMLFGGTCQTTCQGTLMGGGQQLCSGRNTVCCNTHSNRCKERGGECISKCPGAMPTYDASDCKSLGRQCCIALY